jgi:hypothetical protein
MVQVFFSQRELVMKQWLKQHWFNVALLVALAAVGVSANWHRLAPRPARLAPPSTSQSIAQMLPLGPPPSSIMVSPAADERPEEPRTLTRVAFKKQLETFNPSVDILKKMNVTIENEFAGNFGITDEAIRGAADASYERMKIAHPSIKDYHLVVRPNGMDGGANTQFFKNQKRVVVSIDPSAWQRSAAHELTHVLSGMVIQEDWLPGFLREFVATAAEPMSKDEEVPITYEQFNRPILSIAKTVNRKDHQINAMNAPLDGIRYDLLRAAGRKIGTDRHRELARKIYDQAAKRGVAVPLEEFKPLFDEAGIGDCVLFQTASAEGTYLDVAMFTNGIPLIMFKQIDQSGVESVPMASLRLVWRKNGDAIGNVNASTTPVGLLADQSGAVFAPFADTYEITLGTTTYTYKISDR